MMGWWWSRGAQDGGQFNVRNAFVHTSVLRSHTSEEGNGRKRQRVTATSFKDLGRQGSRGRTVCARHEENRSTVHDTRGVGGVITACGHDAMFLWTKVEDKSGLIPQARLFRRNG